MFLEELKKIPFFKDINLQYAFDCLTKVLNRKIITSYVEYLVETKTPFTLCLSDLDNFKNVNDSYGHMFGDEVLETFAETICKTVGDKGIVGRYGGDEFLIVLPNINEYDEVWQICHSLNVNVGHIKYEKVPELITTCTTGISRYPIDGAEYDEIFTTVDKALYRGKSKGRNCFIIYLASKHANISIEKIRENQYNSMEMLTRVFDIITADKNVTKSFSNLLQYLSTYLIIDSISLDSHKKTKLEFIHPQCKTKEFGFVEPSLYEIEMNSFGMFYLNSRKSLLQINQPKLFNELKEKNIYAIAAVKIICNGSDYGLIIAKSTNNRIWQPFELDLLVVAAKLIGQVLFYNNITLDDIEKLK